MTETDFTPGAVQAVGPADIAHRAYCTDCDWTDENEGGAAAAENHARDLRHVVNVEATMATTYWPREEAVIGLAKQTPA